MWRFQQWALEQRVGHATRKLMLFAIATMAETNTGYCFARQDDLAHYAECSDRTVRAHLAALEKQGLIARQRRFSPRGYRLADGFLLLAEWVTEWPDGTPVTNPVTNPVNLPAESSGRGLPENSSTGSTLPVLPETQASGQEEPKNNLKEEEERAREDALSDNHRALLDVVEPVLRHVAGERGALAVSRGAVAQMLAKRLDKPHPAAVERFEHYWLHGLGQNRQLRDVVAAYRNWIDKEPSLEPRRNAAPRARSEHDELRAEGVAALRRLQGRDD